MAKRSITTMENQTEEQKCDLPPEVIAQLLLPFDAPIELADPEIVQQLTEPFHQSGGALNGHVVVSETYRQHVNRFNTDAGAFDVSFRSFEDIEDLNGFIIEVSFFRLITRFNRFSYLSNSSYLRLRL